MNNNPTGKNAKTPIGLRNLTRKSMEQTTQQLLRINAKSDTHSFPVLSDKASKHAHGTEGYTPRIKHANEATPPANDLWLRGTYRVGDGEQMQVIRPGSMDASTKPSRGYST